MCLIFVLHYCYFLKFFDKFFLFLFYIASNEWYDQHELYLNFQLYIRW